MQKDIKKIEGFYSEGVKILKELDDLNSIYRFSNLLMEDIRVSYIFWKAKVKEYFSYTDYNHPDIYFFSEPDSLNFLRKKEIDIYTNKVKMTDEEINTFISAIYTETKEKLERLRKIIIYIQKGEVKKFKKTIVGDKIIRSIHFVKPDKGDEDYKLVINEDWKNIIDFKIEKPGIYKNMLINLAKEKSVSRDRGFYDYYNSNSKSIFKKMGYKNKVLKFQGKNIVASVSLGLISNKKFKTRFNRSD